MSDRMATLSCLCMLLFCFFGVYGQQPIATLRGPELGIISESIGSVDVCVNVSNAEQIPVGGAEIEVSVTNQGVNPATPEIDFSPQQQTLTFMPGTTSRCISFMIINDSVVEVRQESMIIRISSREITIDTASDIVFLTIEDDDRLEIGFTQTQYAILESVSSFELCAQIESGLIAPDLMDISLEIFLTAGGNADINLDFIKNLNDMYVFSNSTPRRECILISIVDDEFVEANETFSVRLIAGASADFVTFTRQEAAVIIEDDDFATVTIGPQQLTVAEGNDTMNSTLQLCVFLGGIMGNVQREVIVNITATELTSTGKDDFALLSNSITLPSNARSGDTGCFDVLIIGDNFIETDEVFRVTISTLFPDFVGDPSSATITVTRDGDAVCSILQSPVNGAVVLTGNTVGSTATYSCIPDYMLVGPQTRECTANAGWSEQDSLCRRTCEDLTIRNGAVNTDLGVSIEGAIATYTCNSEYELNTTSNLSRVCQSNGQWNGTDPTCIGNCGMLPDPDNGMVTHINGTLEGAVAIFTCAPGFDLIGDNMRVCGNNARWFGSQPRCSGVSSVSSAGKILLVMPVLMLTLLTHLLMQ